MTKLSVNINKVALLRNSRGGNVPDLYQVAIDCERFGAQGITVHPRPDQRHITYEDVFRLKEVVQTELNVEGYPSDKFMQVVCDVLPDQVTLVPDPPGALTSNAGWDTITNLNFLKETIAELKSKGIRTSVFIDTDLKFFGPAAETGTDRIELYTEAYASAYKADKNSAVKPYTQAANEAARLGLGLNAGHDLNDENLRFFKENVPGLLEVSIGHALISSSLYFGLENVIQRYLHQLR
ncbi:MAG: pyridoxine 5'-phosphate synthase [Bacteroidetes bacterium]|nr:pyridoxine 5'-phosphate synthase [Bacteroidota bacterium]